MGKNSSIFQNYIDAINEAYLRGDSTEHTHRPALVALIEALDNKITANTLKKPQKGATPSLE